MDLEDDPRFARWARGRARLQRLGRQALDLAQKLPMDFLVAWAVCAGCAATGYWLGRRECRR